GKRVMREARPDGRAHAENYQSDSKLSPHRDLPSSPVVEVPLHSTGDASHPAALLLHQILPVFSVVAPCWLGASPVSVRRGTPPRGCWAIRRDAAPTVRRVAARCQRDRADRRLVAARRGGRAGVCTARVLAVRSVWSLACPSSPTLCSRAGSWRPQSRFTCSARCVRIAQ